MDEKNLNLQKLIDINILIRVIINYIFKFVEQKRTKCTTSMAKWNDMKYFLKSTFLINSLAFSFIGFPIWLFSFKQFLQGEL